MATVVASTIVSDESSDDSGCEITGVVTRPTKQLQMSAFLKKRRGRPRGSAGGVKKQKRNSRRQEEKDAPLAPPAQTIQKLVTAKKTDRSNGEHLNRAFGTVIIMNFPDTLDYTGHKSSS